MFIVIFCGALRSDGRTEIFYAAPESTSQEETPCSVRRKTGCGMSARVVVYEDEGVNGVNDGGGEFSRMRKSLIDSTLRVFELDLPETGIEQDYCENFAIKRAGL
jgi:hypothetical protein